MNELHRCYRGGRCIDFVLNTETHARHGARIDAPAGLCESCSRHVKRSIAGLPLDYTELNTLLAGGCAGLRQIVAGTRELPVPISLYLQEIQAAMVHETLCWAESVAETIGIYWDTQRARDARPGPILQRACRLLAREMPTLMDLQDVLHAGWLYGEWTLIQRDGLDGALTLLDLHHRARYVIGHTRYSRIPAPCPRCERSALRRDDGGKPITIDCSACGAHFTWDEYEAECGILAEIHTGAA